MALDIGELTGYLNLDSSKFTGGVGKALDALKSKQWKTAGAGAGIAAGAALAVGFKGAVDMQGAMRKVSAQLGLTEDEAERAGRVAGQLYKENLGDSMDDVADIIGSVIGNIDGMREASEEDLALMGSYAGHFADTMDVSVSDATKSVGTLLREGMVDDGEQGFDLLTRAAQDAGPDMIDPLMDATKKFGPRFAEIGFDGETTMAILSEAAQGGSKNLDATARSVRRMGERVKDVDGEASGALQSMGLDTKDLADAMNEGGDAAADATAQIADGLLDIKDPTERLSAASDIFGKDLRNMSDEEFPAFLESLSGAGDGLENVDGATQDLIDKNDDLGNKLGEFGRAVQLELIDMMQGAVDWLDEAAGGLDGLVQFVKPAVVALGLLGGSVLAINAGIKIWNGLLALQKGAMAVATAAQWAFNAAMSANPIGLVVTAIGLLIGGLVLFFTKTELGQEIWEKVWGGIKSVASSVADWFMESFLPFFTETIPDAFRGVLDWVGENWPLLLGILTGPIGLAVGYIVQNWDEVRDKTVAVFTAIGEFFGDVAGWIDSRFVQPVVRFFTETVPNGIQRFKDRTVELVGAARDRMVDDYRQLKARFFDPIIKFATVTVPGGFVKLRDKATDAVARLRTGAVAEYQRLKGKFFDPIVRFATVTVPQSVLAMRDKAVASIGRLRASAVEQYGQLKARFFDPIVQFATQTVPQGFLTLRDKAVGHVTTLRDKLKGIYDGIKSSTFDPLVKLVKTTIPNAFKTGVNSAGEMFAKLKEKTKTPVNFVIDPVYAGIRNLWNPVAKTFGKSNWSLPTVAKLAAGDSLDRVGSGFETKGAKAIVGEGRRQYPEYVIPTDPRYRHRALGLHQRLSSQLGTETDNGVQMLAGGGALGWVKDKATAAKDKVVGWAEDVLDNLDDPVGFIRGKLSSLTDGIGTGRMAQTMKAVPGKALDAIKSKVDGFLSGGGGGGGVPAGTGTGGSLAWASQVARKHGLTMTSGYRPGARTSSGSLSMHGLNRARDYSNSTGPTPQMMAFFNEILANSAPTELLYTPAGARNVHRGGRQYANSGAVASLHRNHVHVAYRKGGALGGIGALAGEPIGGYELGTLSASPGWHMVGENGPELLRMRGGEQVRTAEQTARDLAGGLTDEEMERFARIVAAEVRDGSREGVSEGMRGSAGRARTTTRMGAV